MTLSPILRRAEFFALLGVAFFLPILEAPKNVSIVLFVALWLINRVRDGDWGGPWSKWDTLMALLAGSAFLAAAFGALPAKSWRVANDVLSYCTVFAIVRRTHFDARQIRWLLGLLAVATLLALGNGFWSLLVTAKRQTLELRSVGHVNHSAIYIAIVFGVALSAACALKATRRMRIAMAVVALLLFGSLLATAARGAIIPALLFATLWMIWWRRRQGGTPWRTLATLAIIAGAGIALSPEIFQKTVENFTGGHAGSFRPALAKTAILAVREAPWFGVGPTNFGKITEAMAQHVQTTGPRWFADSELYFSSHAHGLYFNTAAERGLVGLAALLLILAAWGLALKRAASDPEADDLAQVLWGGALGAWILTAVGGLFNTTLHHEHATITCLLIGLWLSWQRHHPGAVRRILVIRTDNIGDLVCTTPLLAALRERFPAAWIGVLTNDYSAPALAGHPAIDALFAYGKIKHLEAGESKVKAYLARLRLVLGLRRAGIDLAVLAAPKHQPSARRFAHWIGATVLVGGEDAATQAQGAHEVEQTFFGIAAALQLPGQPGACRVVADLALVDALRARLPAGWMTRRRIGLHVSARKLSQRWPADACSELVRQLVADGETGVLLFWSPGPADDPRHPGDDDKARAILADVPENSVFPVPTARLADLMAGLALCDMVIQADGGAMHIAAGLGKPIVCLFGDSDAYRWHPWGVPHIVLQPPSRDVRDISVAEVVAAYRQLLPTERA